MIPLLLALISYISVKYSMKDTPKTNVDRMQASIQNNLALIVLKKRSDSKKQTENGNSELRQTDTP